MRISAPTRARTLLLAAIALLFLVLPGDTYAQRYLGSIQGEVTDATGAKVPSARVTAEETTTHFKTLGKANGAGTYSFPSLNPGTYKVTLTAQGFKGETRDGVVLTAGQLQ